MKRLRVYSKATRQRIAENKKKREFIKAKRWKTGWHSRKVAKAKLAIIKAKIPKSSTHLKTWQEHILHLFDIQELKGYINLNIWKEHGGAPRAYERVKKFIRERTLIPTENKNIHGQIREYKFRLLVKDEKELETHFSIIKMLRDRDRKKHDLL